MSSTPPTPAEVSPSFTFFKQYKTSEDSASTEVTYALTSHWPCITDSVVYALTGSRQLKGKQHSTYAIYEYGTCMLLYLYDEITMYQYASPIMSLLIIV